MKRIAFFLVCFSFFTNQTKAQIELSEVIQESKIASKDNNALYFVDFWATWCGPCVYAKEMLTVLQRQYPSNFYVISISDESPDLVKKYISKRPTDLAIVTDFEEKTFKKYNIISRPNGILFNARGDKIWQGHPADLSKSMMDRFLRQNRSKTSLYNFVNVVASDVSVPKDYEPTSDIEVKSIIDSGEILSVENTNTYLKLTGNFKDILGYLSKIYENQIEVPAELNSGYQVYFKKPYNATDNLAYKLINKLGYGVERFQKEGELLALELSEKTSFWDTNFIDWGKDSPNFLVSDSDIKADNVSLKELSYQIAHVLNMPVVIVNEDERSLLEHDWDMHYKFYKLMQSSMLDNYGIKVDKRNDKFPVYKIIKKAP